MGFCCEKFFSWRRRRRRRNSFFLKSDEVELVRVLLVHS